MTARVQALPGKQNNTHDVRLFNGVEELGLILVENNRLQEIPISEGAREFQREQSNWYSGMGRLRFADDPQGYWDAYAMWTMTEGKLFPMPQWRWAKGYRNADYSMPGDVTYQKIDTYISISFTASASYSADKALFWLDWSGAPSALTYRLCSNSGGNPDTVLKSGTITTANATRYGPTEIDWATTQSLTASTVYHLVLYNAGSANDYWSVAVDADGAGSKTSADGSTGWTAAAYSMYYRVVDADTNREWKFFDFKGSTYAVSINDSSSSSVLYINGDRGKATSATSTTLTETAAGVTAGWTADEWIGAYVRIIAGTGAGQVRAITDNDTTTLTVATWDTTPSTDSEYVIYSTPIWQSLTAGLGKVTGDPLVVGEVVYFPQGSTAIRKMEVDYSADQHGFGADSTNTADLLVQFYNSDTETEVWASDNDLSKIKYASEATYATTLSFNDWKKVGSSNSITNMITGQSKMFVFKEDGWWTVSPSRTILPQDTSLGSAVDPANGKAAFFLGDEFWFGWSHSLQRVLADDIADQLNYRAGSQGLIRPGVPKDGTSGIGWRFFAIDGEGSATSSVIIFNGYGWMEAFRGWNSTDRIRNVHWQTCPGTRPRLWCDCNGELIYIEFPLNAANPRRDTGLSYQHYSELTTSTYTAGDETLYKLIAATRLNLEKANSSVFVDWQADDDIGTTTWYEIGEVKNIQRNEFMMNLGEIQQIRLRFRVYTTTATNPPVINSYSIRGEVVSPRKYMWVSSFRVDQNQINRRGSTDFAPDYVYDYLVRAAERATALQMRSVVSTMDDKSVTVSFPVKHQDWSQVLNGKTQWGGYIDVQFRET